MFATDSSSSDFLETDSNKQRRRTAKKQSEFDRLAKIRAGIPRYKMPQSGTKIFGDLKPVEQLTHNQYYRINTDSEESYSPTGLSWDQEEIDEAYRKYDPERYEQSINDQKIKITDATTPFLFSPQQQKDIENDLQKQKTTRLEEKAKAWHSIIKTKQETESRKIVDGPGEDLLPVYNERTNKNENWKAFLKQTSHANVEVKKKLRETDKMRPSIMEMVESEIKRSWDATNLSPKNSSH